MTRTQLIVFCVLASFFWFFEAASLVNLTDLDCYWLVDHLRKPAQFSLVAALGLLAGVRFKARPAAAQQAVPLRYGVWALLSPLAFDLVLETALAVFKR